MEDDLTMLEQLKAFHTEYGHVKITRTTGKQELYLFLRRMREQEKRGVLGRDMQRALVALGCQFNPLEEAWEGHFQKLKSYFEANGHSQVPRDYEDHSLAVFVMQQRNKYREDRLDSAREKRLRQLKFVWEPQENAWAVNIKKMEAFVGANGHADVPKRYEDSKLANFVGEMRSRYKEGGLTSEQVIDLEAIGFEWDPNEARWQRSYADFAEWRLDNKEGWPSKARGEKVLYDWCRAQRTLVENKKQTPERLTLLKAVGF